MGMVINITWSECKKLIITLESLSTIVFEILFNLIGNIPDTTYRALLIILFPCGFFLTIILILLGRNAYRYANISTKVLDAEITKVIQLEEQGNAVITQTAKYHFNKKNFPNKWTKIYNYSSSKDLEILEVLVNTDNYTDFAKKHAETSCIINSSNTQVDLSQNCRRKTTFFVELNSKVSDYEFVFKVKIFDEYKAAFDKESPSKANTIIDVDHFLRKFSLIVKNPTNYEFLPYDFKITDAFRDEDTYMKSKTKAPLKENSNLVWKITNCKVGCQYILNFKSNNIS